MALKFLYIDDEKVNTAKGLIINLDDKINIDFRVEQPSTWNTQKFNLIDNKELNDYDGLLLDFKLQFSNEKDSTIKYSGAELAQSIRNGAKSGTIRDLPIFLCSSENLYIAMFDRTNKDLFDKKYIKESNLNNIHTQKELISFANAYEKLRGEQSTDVIVQKSINEIEDLVILNSMVSCLETPHERIYLLNNFVIQTSGLLVEEELLAIRLGVNIKDSPTWNNFRTEILDKFKYRGILGDCYPRWWQFEINSWWEQMFNKNLIISTAEERVERLNEKYGFGLVAIQLPKHQRYSTFWYKCRLSNTPLDATDGLRTVEMPRYIWQDPSYISFGYLLSDDRELEHAYKLMGPSEIELFDELDKSTDK